MSKKDLAISCFSNRHDYYIKSDINFPKVIPLFIIFKPQVQEPY